MTTTAKAGAMSLLDKYASINAGIEDARRKVAATRGNLDSINAKIDDLRDNRSEARQEIIVANTDTSKLKMELEKITTEYHEKIAVKNRMEKENNMAKSLYNNTKRRIENERNDFLERCREFRASCGRVRAAASILVLEGGVGGSENDEFDARESTDEIDLWRRLEEDVMSDGEEEGEGEEQRGNARKREHKKIDSEMEAAEKEEKESRQNHIEVECELHKTRCDYESARARSSARRTKLAQMRAQLERHRSEVEELEKEINEAKDEVVEANQMANTFEKECQRRKQLRRTNVQASYSNNFNPAPQESATSSSNPYQRNLPVSNPYKAITPTTNTTSNSITNNPYRPRNGNTGASSSHRYAADLMNNNQVTPQQYGDNRRTQHNQHTQHHTTSQRPSTNQQYQHQGNRTSYSRRNRQFGTNVGVSASDSEMTDELRECMAAFNNNNSDDLSVSSNGSSSDDEILSFNIFGKN